MSRTEKPSTLQSVAWETGLAAVKESIDFPTFEAFRSHLFDNMRQNSEEVRKRYGSLILLRLFPEKSLEGVNPLVWRTYQDEKILEDLARLTTLEAEPVIAQFVLEQILVLTPGSVIENSTVQDFISSEFGSFKRDSYSRLRSALIHMGFVSAVPQGVMVQPIPLPDNAFLIALHSKLAITPRIVRLSDIVDAPFWKLLGIRDEATVRSILRDANAKGLIAKYTIVDQLEQITTRYSFEEYLSKAFRL
ncbi:MAG: hypothetical protein ROW48_05035 [Bellilinea sp.]|jgi:hypothetical protein